MIDAAFYWIGVVTCGFGAIGVTGLIAIWAINKTVDLLGFTKTLTQAYGQYLDSKRRDRP
jgi:hypothetical protein